MDAAGAVLHFRAMKVGRSLGFCALVLVAGAFGATGVACNSHHVNSVHITPGTMPEGQEWTGVYFNPVYGYAHIIENGDKIWGRYKWANQSHWGEISGTVEGNVAHFEWTEHDVNPVAPNEARHGHGYWVYKMNKDNIGSLTGEFGLDDDEAGDGKWDALKMKDMKANPNSVTADVKADSYTNTDSLDSTGGDGGASSAPPMGEEPAPSGSGEPSPAPSSAPDDGDPARR